ncbi:hypothetical protein HPB52_011404 [Rhipicephalus sanguineus]|uniref:Uncharacterized protein n=1 Tax=Rhipicephalus sanguineus TaxID=34632 RepID=A0A9D4PGB5_RHISA|nr:hypothetical protein HPB52_011404 [Rhipicephalus sanguineus]
MNNQPEYNPYASAYPTGYDAYGTAYPAPYDPAYQQYYQGYPTGYASTTASQSTASTTVTDVREITDADYGGSSGGGGGSSGSGPAAPSGPPAVTPASTTGQPMTPVKTAPPETSTPATPHHSPTPPSTQAPAPPPGSAGAAAPMPSYSYVCTVTQPVRQNEGYLPSDGMCDYFFYDSLYKDGKNNLLGGIGALEQVVQYFIGQAPKYSKTQFGFSFAPEPLLLRVDYKDPRFNGVIDTIWDSGVSHFGFLDLYKQYTQHGHVTEALTVLKTTDRIYYSPKLSNPSSPTVDEFQLFKPCQDFGTANYDDPKVLCNVAGWTPRHPFPQLAYNLGERRSITYLTEERLAGLACEEKQYNLNLNYALAAYDVDFDHAPPCASFGFSPFGGSFNRLKVIQDVMNFFRTTYTNPKENFNCLKLSVNFNFG